MIKVHYSICLAPFCHTSFNKFFNSSLLFIRFAPTAQVASQQGAYVARLLNKLARIDSTLPPMISPSNITAQSSPEVLETLRDEIKVNRKSWTAGWWLGSNDISSSKSIPSPPPPSSPSWSKDLSPPSLSDLNIPSGSPVSPFEIENWRQRINPFSYGHWGTLAYVGGHSAVADLPWGIQSSGYLTHLFWRSAYLSK